MININANISLEELMAIDPDEIKGIQYEAYKKFIVNRLREVADLVEAGEFKKVKDNYLTNSPAGDGYGTDKYFIDFSISDKQSSHNDGIDLDEAIDNIERLKKSKDNDNLTFHG